MAPDDRKRAYRRDMLLAGVMVVAGLAMSAVSAAQLLTTRHHQMAQATQPLQSTPGAETKPSEPAEPATTGTRPGDVPPGPPRPGTVPPEPPRPDPNSQKAGVTPALPPAPAEKTAAPIKER